MTQHPDPDPRPRPRTRTRTRTRHAGSAALAAAALVLSATAAGCLRSPRPAAAPGAGAQPATTTTVEAARPPLPAAPASTAATAAAPATAATREAAPGSTTPDAPFRQQPPAAGPEPDFRVPTFKRFKLKSGLEVILAEVHDLPLVDLHLVVKTGGGANPPGSAGLADLCANMLDEGTKDRTAIEIADRIAYLGASLATGATWDASTVTLSTTARNLDAAMAIWADVILRPTFAEKELARVRDILLTAVSRRKDSPPTVASMVMARTLFGDKHPYAWPQAGVEESLKKLSVADVRHFYDTYYRPGNAAIIAAGDITEAALRKKLESALGDWKRGRAPAVTVPKPADADKTRIVLVDKPGAPQSSVRVGIVGIRRTDPDYFPVLLMNQILGGSFYRLDMNLRERQQWTYGARSAFETRRTPGPATAGGEFVAAHTADAAAEILKEMRLIATVDVTDEEIGRAKDHFIKSFPSRFATRASTAALLGELAVYHLPDRYLVDYTKKLHAVTKADIRRVAAKHLKTDKMAVVVVGDRASQEPPLAKLAPVELRDLDGSPVTATAAAPAKDGGGPSGSGSRGGED